MHGYQELREAAAWRDISSRGRIRAVGEDRVRLLHAIASNAIEGLLAGQGIYTFFLDAQGRIQADSRVFVGGDHVLLDTEPEVRHRLREHLESFIIMDDVTLEDVTDGTFLIEVAGPQANAATAPFCDTLPTEDFQFVESAGIRVTRTSLVDVSGYWLSGSSGDRTAVIDRLTSAGVVEASDEAFECSRIENRIPRYGVDFGAKNIPHETQQLNAVSFTKGCYTGQEIVERVRSQGQVNRLLVGLQIDTDSVPIDFEISYEGKPVGTMTSATFSPHFQKVAGFAIVRRAAANPGTAVLVGGTSALVFDVSRSAE